MKVYLVYTGEYEDRSLDRVFTTLEAATTYCSYHEGASYEAWETESYYAPSDPYWFVRANLDYLSTISTSTVSTPKSYKIDRASYRAILFDRNDPHPPHYNDQFFSPLGYISVWRVLPLSLYPTEKDAVDFVKNIANEVSKDCFSLATQGKTYEYINDFLKNKIY